MLQGLQMSPKARHTRLLSTTPAGLDSNSNPSKEDMERQSLEDARAYLEQLGLADPKPKRSSFSAQHKKTAPPSSTRHSSDQSTPNDLTANMAAALEAISEISGSDTEPARDEYAARRADHRQHGSTRQYGRDQQIGRSQWAGNEPGEAAAFGEPPSSGGRQVGGFGELEEAGNYGQGDGEVPVSPVERHVRALPASPSYFSRKPEFNDSFLRLQTLMRRYSHLPTAPSEQLGKVAFRTLKDFRLSVGENVKASEYAKCMTLVKRLNRIHPDLLPIEVKQAVAKFTRDINPHNQKTKPIPIDKFGRALGVGKRKTSTARAWVVEGTGEVLVNGKSLADAFGRIHDRDSAVWALKTTARTDKYNVWALVDGGGTTGQAEALAMAVGKALMAHEPALKPALRRGEKSFLPVFIILSIFRANPLS